jgi:glycerophosphoryl diester phosphodiesterase
MISRIWQDFRRGFAQFVAYDLFFKVLAAGVLAPLSSWIVSSLISTSGHLSLSNDQILSFALSPVGLATILLAAAFALAVGFAELAGLIVIAHRARQEQRVSALEALWVTLKRLPSLVTLGALQVALYGLALIPFAAVAGLTYLLLPKRYDVNFVLAEKTAEFWVVAIVGTVLLAGAALVFVRLYLRWIFSVPAVVFQGAGPVTALRSSRRLMEGQWARVGGVLLVWGLVMAAAPIVVTASFDQLGEFIFGRLGHNLGVIIAAAATIMALYALCVAVVTFVGLTVNGLLINHLYHKLRGEGEVVELRPGGDAEKALAGGRARKARRAMVAVGIVVLVAAILSSLAAINRMRVEHDVLVTAHRGSSLSAPENTLSAIERAIEDGADYAEIDVQETADGFVVLLHDTDLMRVAGLGRKAQDLTLAEIRELDAGSWFHPDFAGERIPTLEEAIDVARGRINLQIELKYTDRSPALAGRVSDILREQNFASQAQIVSLVYADAAATRAIDPELEVGYIVYRAVGGIARLDVDLLSVNRWVASEDLVAAVQQAGKDLHVWTVNDRQRMSALIDLGVDGILTDDPALLRSVLEERSQLNDAEKALLTFRNWLRR